MPNSEKKIKSVTLAIIELCLSEVIRQAGQARQEVSQSVEKSIE